MTPIIAGSAAALAVLLTAAIRRRDQVSLRDLPLRAGSRSKRLERLSQNIHLAEGHFGRYISGLPLVRLAGPWGERSLRYFAVALMLLPPLLLVYPPAAIAVVALVMLHPWWSRRQEARVRRHSVMRELPMAVELLRLGITSGLNLVQAIDYVASRTEGVIAGELKVVMHDVNLGRRLASALEGFGHRAGEDVEPLAGALISCERHGAPLSSALTQLAHQTRLDQQRRAEQAARRLTVELLFPVAGCILPAFALLTVAPLLAGSLGSPAFSFH